MIHTTNGKTYVYGVYGADGCECKYLHSLHEDEETAKAELSRLIESEELYGSPAFASIECLEVKP